jgi:hypothetical protein
MIGYIQRVNDYRKITGHGFTFLNIPQSYYGVLSIDLLEEKNIPKDIIPHIMNALENAGIIDFTGIVLDLYITPDAINYACNGISNYSQHSKNICDVVLFSRYVNLYKLLGLQ